MHFHFLTLEVSHFNSYYEWGIFKPNVSFRKKRNINTMKNYKSSMWRHMCKLDGLLKLGKKHSSKKLACCIRKIWCRCRTSSRYCQRISSEHLILSDNDLSNVGAHGIYIWAFLRPKGQCAFCPVKPVCDSATAYQEKPTFLKVSCMTNREGKWEEARHNRTGAIS